MSREALLRRLGWVAVVALVWLAYAGGLDAPFVYDDRIEVNGNATIRSLEEWQAIARYNVSRALLLFTYAFNYHFFEQEPLGYHVTSVIIHCLSAGAALLLVEGVARLAGAPRPLPLAIGVAALWAVHPMTTEGVTYITGRSESLCALFVFLALWAWSAALRAERGWPWRLAALAAFLGAVTSKEIGAMIPLSALAMELLLGRKETRPRAWWAWYLPFLALVAAAVYLRWSHFGHLLPREVDRPLPVQLATQAAAWLGYLRLWLLPVGQTIYHHIPDLSPLSPRGAASVAGLLALAAAGVAAGRRSPAVGWALLSGALFLAPSSSLIPLKESMAEHRAYQLGLYLLLAAGLAWPAHLRRPALVLIPVFLAATWGRNRVWSSEIALWKEAVDHHPGGAEAWYGLGDAYRMTGEFEQAIAAYRRVVELDPAYLDGWNNLGISYASMGDPAGARAAWQQALRLSPSYCKAHNNLGGLAYNRKDLDTAIAEYRSTLAYCEDGDSAVNAHYHLGRIYSRPGPYYDRQRAVVHFEELLQLNPTFVHAEEVRKDLLELTW